MNILKILPAFLLAFFLVACGGEDSSNNTSDMAGENAATDEHMHEDGDDHMHDHADAVAAEMVDGVQVVKVTITDMGYEPSNIKLKAGVPARLVFDQHGTTECSSKIMIPDFGIEKTEIPQGEPTAIEFTPESDGEFTFTCGMKMLKGTLMVGA